ncbi:MAG: glycoside hydrolase family 2 TIM barrel-domain containing protein [Bacteroidota bacterium]
MLRALFLLVLTAATAQAQAVRPGGLFTPGEVRTADGSDDGVAVGANGGVAVSFDPTAEDRWAAFRDVPVGDETVSGFVFDGYLYTPARADSDRRRRRFGDDVTAEVRSNAHHLAFAREKNVEREIALFVTSLEGGTVRIEVPPSVLGIDRVLEFDLAPREGRFLLLNATGPTTRAPFTLPETVRASRLIPAWRFHAGDAPGAEAADFDDSGWQTVGPRHTWNAADALDQRGLADGLDVGPQYRRGVGWYRAVIDAPPAGQRAVLRLEGIGLRGEVFLNGESLGTTTRTYTRTEFDLTGRLRPSRNVVAVRADNRFRADVVPHAADYTFFGGLYRGAEVVTTGPTFAERVQVDTPQVSPSAAVVRVRTRVRGEGGPVRLVVRVEHPEGGVVASAVRDLAPEPGAATEVEQTLPLRLPLLWGPAHPHLYAVHATLYAADAAPGGTVERLPAEGEGYAALDHVTEPLGVRFFEWTPEAGFALNGQRLQLRGVNAHQDGGPDDAWAAGPDQARRDLELAKAMGANFVRIAHYPHHPATLAHADSLGLLVWAEVPFITSDPTAPGFADAASAMFRQMVERDYNHPSVVLWGTGNESLISWQTLEVQAAALALAKRLGDEAVRLDPSRLSVQAQNHVVDPAIMATANIQARNQYAGWYEDMPEDIGPRLDAYHAERPGDRLFLSEYGAGAQRGLWVDEAAAQPFDFSETWALRFHEAYLDALDERPFVAGGAVWHLFDFASHVKTGTLPHVNQKGLLTRDRRPKAAYYLYQSRWTDAPMAWLFAHTRTHREAGAQRIEAFTNAPRATLFVDGVAQGEAVRDGRSTRVGWDLPLAEGMRHLRLVAAWPDGRTATDEAAVFVVPPGTLDADTAAPVQLDGDN